MLSQVEPDEPELSEFVLFDEPCWQPVKKSTSVRIKAAAKLSFALAICPPELICHAIKYQYPCNLFAHALELDATKQGFCGIPILF